MIDSYYLGTLCLEWKDFFCLSPNQTDIRFCTPVLPVTGYILVEPRVEEILPLPQTPPQRFGEKGVWMEDGIEHRSYHYGEEETPNVVSRYSPREGRVCVWIRKECWEKGHIHLRPFFQVHLEELLLDNHAMVLHSASIAHKGGAILFTAPSGTGKTTQTDLWHSFREGVTDVNGDRTLLQWTEKGWYACGFPMFGSSFRCEQTAVPVNAIVIVRQAAEDRILDLSDFQKMTLLFREMMVPPFHERYTEKTFDLIEQLIKKVRVVQLDCTMNASAVSALEQYLYGDCHGDK